MVKLIGWECKKIIWTRSLMLLLAVCLIVPEIIFAADIFSANVGNRFSPSAYRALSREVDNEDLVGSEEKLRAVYESMWMDWQEPERMHSADMTEELFLYEQVLNELSQINGYRDYLTSVRLESERQGGVSLFSRSDKKQRNIEKTVRDFAKMESVQVDGRYSSAYGTELFMRTGIQELFLMAAALLLVSALVSSELESGRLKVVFAAAHGRSRTAYAKYLAGTFLNAAFVLLLYGSRMLLAAVSYGLGNLSAPFQTVYGAEGCTMHISIAGAIVLFFIFKLLVMQTIFSILFLLALWCRYAKVVYCVGIGLSGVFYLAYSQIDATGHLANVKWVNPAAFLFTDRLLTDYRNLSLFGYPVGYRMVMIGVCLIAIAFVVVLAGKSFMAVRHIGKLVVSEQVYAFAERVLTRGSGRSLGGYEYRKWSFYQKGIAVCLVLLLIAATAYAPASERLYTRKEIYYKYYIEQIRGPYSEDKVAFLYTENEMLDEIENSLAESGSGYTSAAVEYYQRELARREGLEAAIVYGEYLREKPGSHFVYEQGYEMLFGSQTGGIKLFWYRTLSLAVAVLLAALIWGIETDSGMERLIHVSAVGTHRINRKKRLQILISGLFVFSVVYLPWIYSVCSVFGTWGMNAPACSLMRFAIFPVWIPLWVPLTVFYVMHLGYLWLAGILMQHSYQKMKALLPASIVVFGIGMIPILLLGS